MLQSCCQPEGDVDDFVRSTVLPTVLISLKRTVLLSSSYNLQLSFLQKGKSATAMLLVLMKQVLITRQIATIRRPCGPMFQTRSEHKRGGGPSGNGPSELKTEKTSRRNSFAHPVVAASTGGEETAAMACPTSYCPSHIATFSFIAATINHARFVAFNLACQGIHGALKLSYKYGKKAKVTGSLT